MSTLADLLPDLVIDLEGALLPLGRGDLAQQLPAATLAAWRYDEFSDTVYLQLSAAPVDMMNVERLSLFDELGMNVDCDPAGRVCGIEILEGRRVAERLQTGRNAQ